MPKIDGTLADGEWAGAAELSLPEGKAYLLEPNPNPDLAHDDDFAKAAQVAGIQYEPLIQRVLNLARRYEPTAST